MNINLNGKRALVTGAARGIGRAIAEKLIQCGAQVIALDILEEDLQSLSKEYPQITPLVCDLADWDKTKAAVTSVLPIDLLVNNAGVHVMNKLIDFEESEIDKILNINVKALINVSQVVAKNMIEREVKGSIVNISSISSKGGFRMVGIYAMSKAAVDSVTESMCHEFGEYGIRVNSVNPGIVHTPMTAKMNEIIDLNEYIRERCPLNQFVKSEDVAYSVVYLLSDQAAMVSGNHLIIDGGSSTDRTGCQ